MARFVELVGTDDAVEALVASYERSFLRSDLLTLGLEEELILLEPDSFEPANKIESVLMAAADPRIVAEFRAAQVELVMPASPTVSSLRSELAAARERLVSALGGRVRLLAAGAHPSSTASSSAAR